MRCCSDRSEWKLVLIIAKHEFQDTYENEIRV